MKISKNEVRAGDVMIGHNLLATPALLLEKKIRLDEGRLLDFCTLITGLVLHDRLITLKAEIPYHIKDTDLHRYLQKTNTLCELDFRFDQFGEQERQEINHLFNESFSEEEANLVLGREIERQFYDEFYAINVEGGDYIAKLRDEFIDQVIGINPNDWKKGIPKNSVLYRYREGLRRHRLRTIGYWEISGMLNIGFLPDLVRIPLIAGYQRGIIESIRTLLQRTVDHLKHRSELALRLAAPIIIPMPAPVSNFLDLYSSTNSVEESLDKLRKRFAEHKDTIVKWEDEFRKPNRTAEGTEKIIRDMQAKLSSINVKTDVSDIVADIGPGLAEDLVSGKSIGAGTSIHIGEQAYKYLIAWWRRGRISYLYNGKKEADRIENQPRLLRKAFGDKYGYLTPGQGKRFVKLTQSLEDLTKIQMS